MADVESRKEKVEKRKRKSGWKKIAFAVAGKRIFVIL